MEKYKNKYRTESNRMPGWDYSRNGYYFITVVTKDRICWFGDVKNGKMIFSDFGKIANDEWFKSFKIRRELFLDEFILMPNHLHAIIILNNPDNRIIKNDGDDGDVWDVETHGRASLHPKSNSNSNEQTQLIRKPKSISSFIGGYKSVVNTKIDDLIDSEHLGINKFNRKNRLWQVNYNDHIIRNKREYMAIKKYIQNNPKNWNSDKFNSGKR
jgi:REP element-mobilizing transposase RayT